MDRASLAERIWYETSVPVFLEKFILPVLATVIITVIMLNPFKLDGQQQVSLSLAVVALAYFVGHTVHRLNNPPKSVPLPQPMSQTRPAEGPITHEPPLGSQPHMSTPKTEPLKSEPRKLDSIHIEQHNDAPGSISYAVGKGNLTVNEAPPSRELSEKREAQGRDVLSVTKGAVRIIFLGSNNGEAQRLTQQIYRMFDGAHWEIQQISLGTGPVPPGVRLVGDPENQFVATAKKAFDSAHLDCIVGPGYAGPLGAGPPPSLTITIGPRPD